MTHDDTQEYSVKMSRSGILSEVHSESWIPLLVDVGGPGRRTIETTLFWSTERGTNWTIALPTSERRQDIRSHSAFWCLAYDRIIWSCKKNMLVKDGISKIYRLCTYSSEDCCWRLSFLHVLTVCFSSCYDEDCNGGAVFIIIGRRASWTSRLIGLSVAGMHWNPRDFAHVGKTNLHPHWHRRILLWFERGQKRRFWTLIPGPVTFC